MMIRLVMLPYMPKDIHNIPHEADINRREGYAKP